MHRCTDMLVSHVALGPLQPEIIRLDCQMSVLVLGLSFIACLRPARGSPGRHKQQMRQYAPCFRLQTALQRQAASRMENVPEVPQGWSFCCPTQKCNADLHLKRDILTPQIC
jgi:hypothetical protein